MAESESSGGQDRGEAGASSSPARHPEPTALYTSLSSPVMVWVTDPGGVCTFLSESWYSFTGQTPATGLGLGWLGAVHPDDQELAEKTFLAANAARCPFRLDYRLRRSDGVYRWAIDAATPHFGEGGAFLGFIGSVIDITERKEAEAALRDSEGRYRNLFESIEAGFCVAEIILGDLGGPVDYRFLELNPAFTAQTGLGVDDALGKTILEVIPDLEPYWIETYGKVALTGESTRFEHEAAALGRWYDVYAFRLGGPESLKVAMLFNNVTERRRVASALRDSEARYRGLFESIDEGFNVIDVILGEDGRPVDYRFLEINPAFAAQTGLKVAETLGKTVLEIIPDLEPFWIETYGRVALTGEPTRFENEAASLGRWYDVYAFRLGGPESLKVAVLFNDVTERRRAEHALRDSEARYRGLFRSLDAGFCVVEIVLDAFGRPVDYRFVEINPAFSGQSGLDPERTVGRTALELVPDLEPFWIETYGRVALTGESVRFENESEPMGRTFEVYAFQFGEPGGLEVAILFNDVTERRRAEASLADLNATLERRVETRTAELARSEQRFTQAFNAGPVAACITSLDLKTVLEVNEAFSKLTGYSRAEAVGRSSEALGLWESQEYERLERAAEAAGGASLEFRLRTKAGSLRDVTLSAAVIRLEDHYGYLTMFYDVTERREAERWGGVLRGALDSAEESVVVTTADLDHPKIVYVNAAFSKMTGYDAAEVLGRTPRMLQGPDSDPLVWGRMRGELEANRNAVGETVNYRKDGSTFTLSWNIAPIYGGAGGPTPGPTPDITHPDVTHPDITHYVSMQRDVTERRALERELLDVSAREQRRIVGDLNDSVQQQLVATALEAKRLAALARETDPALGAELETLVAHIQTGVRGVRAVLGDLTPLQPGDNGLMVALENLCLRVTALFGVPCTFSFEQPLLFSDFARAAHLFFIAQEAAINAAKHAAAGRIDVRLTGTPERFTLSVSDDGSGVNDEVLGRYRGTGLGLMEERAELLGAPLEVRSQPGRGTTVSVSLGG